MALEAPVKLLRISHLGIASPTRGAGIHHLAFEVDDVNATTSIALDAKIKGGKSAAWILGGGSPKNFILQTEPQIQEVLGIDERGHDTFLHITDTGGLSGAPRPRGMPWPSVKPGPAARPRRCVRKKCDLFLCQPSLLRGIP